MPRHKSDEPSRATVMVSLYFALDRALKALSLHTAYGSICDDIRSILRMATPDVEAILKTKTVVPSDDTVH